MMRTSPLEASVRPPGSARAGPADARPQATRWRCWLARHASALGFYAASLGNDWSTGAQDSPPDHKRFEVE